MIAALIKTARPHQWVKNGFVAAPLVFSRHLLDASYVARELIAVIAFCALSGAVYAFNDVRDVVADRAHPTKRLRPIASGALAERTALIAAAGLAIVALTSCLVIDRYLALYAAIYLAQNIAYSVRLKHIAFVDVGLIAAGFLLRVLAGAAAIDVPPSPWLLACTALLATLLGLGKRAHELTWAERSGGSRETRAALAGYRIGVLRLALYVLALATTGAYIAYSVDHRTVTFFATDKLAYSTPFVALAIVRYLYLALWRPTDDSPTDAMLRDPWFLIDVAGAIATIIIVIYAV